MKTSILQGLAAALFAAEAAAKNIGSHSVPKGAVELPMRGHSSDKHPNPRYEKLRKFSKRDDTLQVTLNNEFTYYSVEIEVGTPVQKLKTLIDTGSSDLWVLASNNPYCAEDPDDLTAYSTQIDCTESGTFNYNKSSSFDMNSTDFFISYGDLTFAEGKWGTDKLTFGKTSIDSVSIGIGMRANSSQNVFGVGLTGLESTNVGSTAARGKSFTYPNVPVLLKEQGDIKRIAYSLYLDDIDAKTGNILFGGVDKAKYSGDLVTVPLVNNVRGVDSPIEFTVMLSEMSLTDSKGTETTIMKSNIPALLDSGTTLTFLPTDIVTSIATSLDAEYSSSIGMFVSPCSDGQSKGALNYDFNGAKIKVPLEQLFMELQDTEGNTATFSDGSKACALALNPSDDQIILGDSFLRSAYVVYDLEGLEVGLANTKFGESDSDIVVIESGIPNAKKASGYSSTQFATDIQISTAADAVFSHPSGSVSDDLETSSFDFSSATGSAASTATGSSSPGRTSATATSRSGGGGNDSGSSGAAMTAPVFGTLFALAALAGALIV